jgi:hypothetical protein
MPSGVRSHFKATAKSTVEASSSSLITKLLPVDIVLSVLGEFLSLFLVFHMTLSLSFINFRGFHAGRELPDEF